jgi:hypothetical protein
MAAFGGRSLRFILSCSFFLLPTLLVGILGVGLQFWGSPRPQANKPSQLRTGTIGDGINAFKFFAPTVWSSTRIDKVDKVRY